MFRIRSPGDGALEYAGTRRRFAGRGQFRLEGQCDAEAWRGEDYQARGGRAFGRRQGPDVLGPRPSGLRGPGLPLGAEEVRRAVPRPVRDQAGLAGRARRSRPRGGAQAGARRDRAHQAGRGAGSRPRAGGGADGGRAGGALPGGACVGELQRGDPGELPGGAAEPHPAGAGREAGGRGPPFRRGGAALRAARPAAPGQPGAGRSVDDVRAGGGLGIGAIGRQPVPLRGALPAGHAGALPDGGRVPPGGPGAVCA